MVECIVAFQPTRTETTPRTGLASATSEERRALSHGLESEPHAPLHARCACKMHGHIVSCHLAGKKGQHAEPAENDEGLQEEQKQYASTAPRHRTGRILRYGSRRRRGISPHGGCH